MIPDKTTKGSHDSGFATLPHGILSRIFELTLRDSTKEAAQATRLRSSAPGSELSSIFYNRAYQEAHTVYKRESPQSIAQVCSHWRKVALETPKVWAALHVSEHHFTGTSSYMSCAKTEGEQKIIQCLRTYLERSRSEPFSLTMVFRTQHCATWDLMPLLDEILTNLPRFKLLNFSVRLQPALNIFPILFERIATEGSQLEELAINTDSYSQRKGDSQVPQLDLRLSPALKHLFINRFMVELILPNPAEASLHRLKFLDMAAGHSPGQLLYWISLLPELESVSLQELVPKFDDDLLPEGREGVTSHSLKTLVITKSLCQMYPGVRSAFTYFLAHFCAPGLESLRVGGRDRGNVHYTDFPMGSAESEICEFIQRSSPSLKELVMGADISKEALLGLLSRMPAMERLELHETLASDEVLRVLTDSSISPSLCPELKAIWLLLCDPEDLSSSMVIKLLESRCERIPGSKDIEDALAAAYIANLKEAQDSHVETEKEDRWFKNIKRGLLNKLHIKRSHHHRPDDASGNDSQSTSITPTAILGDALDIEKLPVRKLRSVSVWGGKLLDEPKPLEDFKAAILSSYDLDYFELHFQDRQRRMYPPEPIEDDVFDEE